MQNRNHKATFANEGKKTRTVYLGLFLQNIVSVGDIGNESPIFFAKMLHIRGTRIYFLPFTIQHLFPAIFSNISSKKTLLGLARAYYGNLP